MITQVSAGISSGSALMIGLLCCLAIITSSQNGMDRQLTGAGGAGAHHHAVISESFLLETSSEEHGGREDDFQRLDFFSRKFYVKSPVKGTSDIIKWVEGGREGEGKVSLAFERELRLGREGNDDHESGLCARYNHQEDQSHGHNRPIVLDIGANAGIYGMYAAALGCAAYFFDIQEVCQKWIAMAIRKNDFSHRAFVVPFAVGNQTRTITYEKKSNSCHGVFSLSSTGTEWFVDSMKSSEPGAAKEVRVDDIFKDLMDHDKMPLIAMIKTDTEGFEPHVLAGMEGLLRYKDPKTGQGVVRNLIIEMAPERWAGLPDPLQRSKVAHMVGTIVWDAGFQDAVAFSNNFVCCDKKFSSREDLVTYITSGKFPDNSQDFHFRRTVD